MTTERMQMELRRRYKVQLDQLIKLVNKDFDKRLNDMLFRHVNESNARTDVPQKHIDQLKQVEALIKQVNDLMDGWK